MRALVVLAVVAGCGHGGEVGHAAEVYCRARANEWAAMAEQYRARGELATPSEAAARAADAAYGILAGDARRVWATDASSSFALCSDIRAVDAVVAHRIEAEFAAAHDPFLQGSSELAAQANQLARMAGALRELDRCPLRD